MKEAIRKCQNSDELDGLQRLRLEDSSETLAGKSRMHAIEETFINVALRTIRFQQVLNDELFLRNALQGGAGLV